MLGVPCTEYPIDALQLLGDDVLQTPNRIEEDHIIVGFRINVGVYAIDVMKLLDPLAFTKDRLPVGPRRVGLPILGQVYVFAVQMNSPGATRVLLPVAQPGAERDLITPA